jgi:hypothetical protein
MNRIAVSSSNVVSAGYDEQGATLEVEFSNGHIYQYFDVPQAVYAEFLASSSPGSYLNSNIKGAYRYARV